MNLSLEIVNAFNKTRRVISSCTTPSHIEAAAVMCGNFDLMFVGSIMFNPISRKEKDSQLAVLKISQDKLREILAQKKASL